MEAVGAHLQRRRFADRHPDRQVDEVGSRPRGVSVSMLRHCDNVVDGMRRAPDGTSV